MKKIILLFFGISVQGQQIHHQMLSSQGSSNQLSKGIVVNQTIGQQSVIGNYKFTGSLVGQGFQQSSIAKAASLDLANTITTTTYPNPFVNQIHFRFSSPVSGLITIRIFDLLGRLVYKEEKEASQNLLSLDNLHFAQNEYVVQLAAKNFKYSTHIIQSK